MKNYWAFRVDKRFLSELDGETEEGRLRQGWGWDERQDLRNMTLDQGASRNRRMFEEVKSGDLILVPRLPRWSMVKILEATADWDKGYRFEVFGSTGDHGHVFPVKPIQSFTRSNEHVSGDIRSTLRTPSRFWNVSQYAEDIERLIKAGDACIGATDWYDLLQGAVRREFPSYEVRRKVFGSFMDRFEGWQWEKVLVEVFNSLYPEGNAERVGGKGEEEHGTDILIKIPSIVPDRLYLIAVQVKDYRKNPSSAVLDQICKADCWTKGNDVLIEKVVVLIGCDESENDTLVKLAAERGVKVLFRGDVEEMLFRYCCQTVASESADFK